MSNASDIDAALRLSFAPLYVPLPAAVPLEVLGAVLTQVATFGWSRICLNDSRRVLVVHSLVAPGREPSWQPPQSMNSSVGQLACCVRVAAEMVRAPDSSERDEETDFDSLSSEIRALLAKCDALALRDQDGFWATFCDDVSIGDWFPAPAITSQYRGNTG